MSSPPAEGSGSSASPVPPVVNTIQAVRSPIWSLPMLTESQLNAPVSTSTANTSIISTPELPPIGQMVTVSGETSSSPVIPLDASSTHRGTSVSGRGTSARTVLAKPLPPRQISPAVTNLVPAHQTPSPLQASNLTQLASQLPKLTPEVILASMKQLQQQAVANAAHQQQQQTIMQAFAGAAAGVATPPMVGSGRVTRGGNRSSKVFAPRQQPLLQQQQQANQLLIPGAAPTMIQAAPHKIIAPVAVPPTSTPVGLSSHHSMFGVDSTTSSTQAGPRTTITTNKPRKPCNCKNSQCLKLYCDCFANGEFCREFCNCQNCKNNMEHTEERAKAVKTCLDRNPHAFKPKVGQNKSGDERRHIKGCNCKRSGCLKNYCECYEAKIPCSSNCRCIGCKNLPEKLENKSLMQLADAADIRTQQQRAATSHFMEQLEMSSVKPQPTTVDGQRLPFSFINKDVAKATCLCLLEEASHSLMNGKSSVEAEKAVMEEFGRCLTQIINSAQSANEDINRSMVVH